MNVTISGSARPHAIVLALALTMAACASASKQTRLGDSPDSNIQVCVVDTIAPGGMMDISAIQVKATKDTVIMQPEGRVSLKKAVAGPKVLSQATWLGARQPLQLTAAAGRIRFQPVGKPKRIAPGGKVILLAMMRGLPVFAMGSEGGAMRPELESLAARGVDLEKALAQRVTLRRQMDRVRTLYVPTSLVGCTFQQFTRSAARRR